MSDRDEPHPAVTRIVRTANSGDLQRTLTDLSGSDLTSLLMAVMSERTSAISAPDALRRHRTDRFTKPSPIPARQLRRAEDLYLHAATDGWEWLTLAPLVPGGTFASMGDLDPKRVVSTIRGTEVAADPTNTLALEAAARTRAASEPAIHRLAAIQRVARAQRFEDADAFAHFTLAGFVTTSRGTPGRAFEVDELKGHLGIHIRALQAGGADAIEIAITDLGDRVDGLFDDVSTTFGDIDRVTVSADPERVGGRSYYRSVCFKVHATFGTARFELADGGDTDWTSRVLSDRKQRCFISGAGLDRLALAF
ncbi:MAG: hypothetical protein QOI81_941 [Actinomycetota bacterium]|nr:hypothetical protein [Actinomycetota bacterium]